jgi:hypothetical protein
MSLTYVSIADLINKKMTGCMSESDRFDLNQILSDHTNQKLFDDIMDVHRTRNEVKIMSEGDMQASWLKIEASYAFTKKRYGLKKLLAIGTVAFLLSLVGAWLLYKESTHSITSTIKFKNLTDTQAVKNAIDSQEGPFIFKDKNIKEILSELARVYHLDVQYKGDIPEDTYYAIFSRTDSIKTILEHLQRTTGIKIKLDEKGILVQP